MFKYRKSYYNLNSHNSRNYIVFNFFVSSSFRESVYVGMYHYEVNMSGTLMANLATSK